MIILINTRIITMEDKDFKNGYIVIDKDKISDIGDMSGLNVNYDNFEKVIDVQGRLTLPGFVEAHSHIGIWEDSLNFEGADGNEDTDPVTPQLRALDAVNPMDRAFEEALMSGVTTVVTGPGSANPIGGQILAMKTMGKCADDMVVKQPLAIKIAFGENPKATYNDKNQTPSTRMATAAIIRENLKKAVEYMELWDEYENNKEENDRPDIDFKLEALLPVVRREIPVHAHAHRADDIFTAIRIAKEFNIKLVLVHCTEGHLIKDELKRESFPLLIGPSFSDRSKPELRNLTFETPAILAENNIDVSIITDHPETPVKYLNICAGMAVREGMKEIDALKAITINPAKSVGISDRVGSLKVGKDADIVIWDRTPLEILAVPHKVICNGIIVK